MLPVKLPTLSWLLSDAGANQSHDQWMSNAAVYRLAWWQKLWLLNHVFKMVAFESLARPATAIAMLLPCEPGETNVTGEAGDTGKASETGEVDGILKLSSCAYGVD